jgi:surfeit locus 1 family protein
LLVFLPERGRYALGQLFGRRWRWVTLGVFLICVVLARLGVWQLDRLAERRARSAELAARLEAPALTLTAAGLQGSGGPEGAGGTGAGDPAAVAYRRVVARGTFDYSRELALVNQVHEGQLGFHLLTPLVLEAGPSRPAGAAVLVDRGWVPAATAPGQAPGPDSVSWTRYRGPEGVVEVTGWVHPAAPSPSRSLGVPGLGGPPRAAPAGRLVTDLDPARLQASVDQPLLPLVVVQAPDAGALPARGSAGTDPDAVPAAGAISAVPAPPPEALPYRQRPNPDLGDGVHLIVAVQWFAFSVIGAVGYLFYLGRQLPDGASRGAAGARSTRGRPLAVR